MVRRKPYREMKKGRHKVWCTPARKSLDLYGRLHYYPMHFDDDDARSLLVHNIWKIKTTHPLSCQIMAN